MSGLSRILVCTGLLLLSTKVATGQTPVDSTAPTPVDSAPPADSVAVPAPAAPVLPGNLRLVSADLRFKSISAGTTHACGLTAEGKAYCWGKNTWGQLGDSTTTDSEVPVAVSAGLSFQVISVGGRHTCAIAAKTFEPYCWGNNENGQLGNGTRVSAKYPFLVAGSKLMTLIFAGPEHTCGTQKHWDKQDQALCWGLNSDGQLGEMSTETSALPAPPFGVIRYVSLSLGTGHTCGATREGRVFCWGTNIRGQLGNGSATESRVPFMARMNRRSDFTMVASGSAHTCALSGDGHIICWGENTDGAVGTGAKGGRVLSPVGIKDSSTYTAVYAARNTTCGHRKDGAFVCWGSNENGLYGASDQPGSRTPVPVLAGTTLTGVSLGPGMGCAIQADGTGVCWGRSGPTGSK